MKTVAEIEKYLIVKRLARFNGNRTKAAKSLGLSVRTLQRKLAKWPDVRQYNFKTE